MLEVIGIEGNGFVPLKDYKSWRIAQLSYKENNNSLEGVQFFGRHLETDEVFLLLKGEAKIFTAGFEDEFGEIQAEEMINYKLYTVKEKQWHAVILKPGAQILIVENSSTDDSNSQSYKLTPIDKMNMNSFK
ncbi:cupin domain-containing protein [Alkaliphilus peptidifermentans]|uniref:Cupin domain-containing protein n=1 Tax=Alkaliphilus peptidifermentans DSM 18978 TaxID=1120976 RepID=A0A1G5F0M7_9FIRM|nr:hypothetical protein [Alkaliphilus peptidifermentans]SCY32809.1 hypothetical protein SAMN03080606_01297 [Alkaliphilus peptidifermentans DSM 18978]